MDTDKKKPQDFTCDAIKGELSIPLFSFILLGAKLRKSFENAKMGRFLYIIYKVNKGGSIAPKSAQ